MVQDTLYRAVLVRIDRGDNYDDAIKSVTKEFLSDYIIAPEKTFFIPTDVNGKTVSQVQVLTKSEAIKLDVEEGTYLDSFMGADGYKHYASETEIENLSDEDIKTRIKSAIQNDSQWLLNDTSTGLVLHFTWYDGTKVPVMNGSGQKIEFNLLAKVFKDFYPQVYPYDVGKNAAAVFKAQDFDERVDIMPVSDPNIFSMSQRVTLAQTQLQMAQSDPQSHNLYEAYKRMYQSLGVKDIDAILPPPKSPAPRDPAIENADSLLAKKIYAFRGQDHQSHIDANMQPSVRTFH